MIYIIYPDVDVWNFVLKGVEDNYPIIKRPLNRYCQKWQLAFRKTFPNLRSSKRFLFNKLMRKELKGIKEGDSLVLCDYRDLCLIRTLSSSLQPKVKKYLWLWNPIKTEEEYTFKNKSKIMKEEGFILSTFDSQDANKYDLILYNQFFRMNIRPKELSKEAIDFYFIGFSKNREDIILQLKKDLSDFKTFFKIVHNNSEYISYEENIKLSAQSRCLVEIIQQGQSGMSLRPLEALALHKKLISNNKDLVNMDFYHPNNIFILGLDSITKIHQFMESPMETIDEKIILKYDVSTWLKNFI